MKVLQCLSLAMFAASFGLSAVVVETEHVKKAAQDSDECAAIGVEVNNKGCTRGMCAGDIWHCPSRK